MRKLITLILIIAFSTPLFGCSNSPPEQRPVQQTPQVQTTKPADQPVSLDDVFEKPAGGSQKAPQVQSKPTDQKELTVYITRTGKKYHRAGCRYLSKSQIPISLKDAVNRGYGPCSVCNPPVL